MDVLSKKDKEIWNKYLLNINKTNLNIEDENYILNHIDKSITIVNKNNVKNNIKNSLPKLIKSLNKGNLKIEAQIDLHGFRLMDAKLIFTRFVLNSLKAEYRNLLVITGKGFKKTGILKKEVPIWLSETTLSNITLGFCDAPPSFGGEGALFIRLRNIRKL